MNKQLQVAQQNKEIMDCLDDTMNAVKELLNINQDNADAKFNNLVSILDNLSKVTNKAFGYNVDATIHDVKFNAKELLDDFKEYGDKDEKEQLMDSYDHMSGYISMTCDRNRILAEPIE